MRFKDEYMEPFIYLPKERITRRRILARFSKKYRQHVTEQLRARNYKIYGYANWKHGHYKIWLDLGIKNCRGVSRCLKFDNESVTFGLLSADKTMGDSHKVCEISNTEIERHVLDTLEVVINSFFQLPVESVKSHLKYKVYFSRKLKDKGPAYKFLEQIDSAAKEGKTETTVQLSESYLSKINTLLDELIKLGFSFNARANGTVLDFTASW